MSSTPPPPARRAPYQRTATGLYVSDVAHPLLVGKRLHLSAKSEHELKEQRRVVEGWHSEYRLARLSLEEFRARLTRFANPRLHSRSLRRAWEDYAERAVPSMDAKLASIWRHQLAPELGELAVPELTARRLSLWEAKQIALGYAPSTTTAAFTYLTAAARMALEDGEDVPWRLGRGKVWRPSRPPEPLKERPACGTPEEAEALLRAALERDRMHRSSPERWRLADLGPRCAVVLFLGLRNAEGGGLGWDDLALEAAQPRARITHQAKNRWRRHHPEWTRPLDPPKRGKTRNVAIHPTAVLALHAQRELLEERGWYRPDGPVFPSHEGTPYVGSWRNTSKCVDPIEVRILARAAKLPFAEDWVTHCLRHSLATLEHTSGADLRSVQRRTGHSSLRVLEKYIHARTGGTLTPSVVRPLDVRFDDDDASEKHDTDPCPPPEDCDDTDD